MMHKPLADAQTLRDRAARDCHAHAERVLGGPITVIIDTSHTAWDPAWLRHVVEQQMTVARPVADVEVVIEAGRVVEIVDHGAGEGP